MQVPQVTQIPLQRFAFPPKFPPAQNFQKQNNLAFPAHRQQFQPNQNIEFDGKRLRKAVTRKTVDYNSSAIKYLEARIWQRDYRDRRVMQPDATYYTEMTPPLSMPDNPINAVTTKFVRTSTNKMRCPIFCVAWTPEGRRLVTGASSGEFTLWNGLTFNFETILQAHDSPVRCMVWSHSDTWMVTGDHAGYVKYWQSNMNNVKMFQAHKEPLRGISFCPVDTKFVTCSDDGTIRIWDFLRCFEEKILRGHGADVKCVDWHPQKSLLVSGSKDSQQPIKLWDPKSGQSLATIHAHKNTVMDAKWNKNGNWLLTASRDHLIKLFDIRNMSQEMQTFRGHKKEATTLAWHPIHEGLFTSGGSDGCVMFWVVGADKEVGCMEQAHDSCVWSLAWHPLGHILCSGSNDHSSKFWTRNRPGDRMRDKYNLNTLPKGQEDLADYDDSGTISSIPGMGLEHGVSEALKTSDRSYEEEIPLIPGLDFTSEEQATEKSTTQKKIPFSKPIPKQFQQQWMESKQPLLLAPPQEDRNNGEMLMPPESIQQPQMMPPQMMQPPPDNFQQNSRGPPNFAEPPLRNPPRSALLGERPSDPPPIPPPPGPEGLAGNRMPDRNFQEAHEQFAHNPPRNDAHKSWRSYSDMPMETDGPKEKNMQNENGSSSMHGVPPPHMQGPDMHRGFEPPPNHSGLPPNRGRPERFPPMEEDMEHDEMRPRGGPPPHYMDDRRYPGQNAEHREPRYPGPHAENREPRYPGPNDEHREPRYPGPRDEHREPRYPGPNDDHREPRFHGPNDDHRESRFHGPNDDLREPRFHGPNDDHREPRNSHMRPVSDNYPPSHSAKRPWDDEPIDERRDFDRPMRDFDGPPMRDFDGPPDFHRQSYRHEGPRFSRGRGPRAPFRGGRNSFRGSNRGRGRGGYN